MAEYVHSVGKQFKELLDKLKQTHIGLKIYYFYPPKFNNLPCISYKLAGNTPLNKTINGQPRRQESSYNVDFWGESPEQLQELADELKNVLMKEKWSCSFEQDMKDPSELYYHKSTRFQLTFDNKLKISL